MHTRRNRHERTHGAHQQATPTHLLQTARHRPSRGVRDMRGWRITSSLVSLAERACDPPPSHVPDAGPKGRLRPARYAWSQSVVSVRASFYLVPFRVGTRCPRPLVARTSLNSVEQSLTSDRCGASPAGGRGVLRFARSVGALAGAREDACEVEARLVEVRVERQGALERRDRVAVASASDKTMPRLARTTGLSGSACSASPSVFAASSNRRAATWHGRDRGGRQRSASSRRSPSSETARLRYSDSTRQGRSRAEGWPAGCSGRRRGPAEAQTRAPCPGAHRR